MNHTPGPWIAGPVFAKQEGRAIFFTDETLPGKWQKRLDDKSGVFSDANARLIAAAPDLLQCLEDAEFLMRKAAQIAGPMQDSFRRSAEDARAAIAKAKGEA